MSRVLYMLGFILLTQTVVAQKFNDLSQKVPFDESIRKGVLPNGITYYIKHNETPKGLASFYIYQNVGAALETDAQNGLAHFLEHMAFNGTSAFPGKAMLNMLEKNGMKFGRDVNAYTTRNETVYNISRVPVKDGNILDSCLMILHDWCDDLELSEEEIDAERGVISEEWRTRRDASFRIREKTAPLLYNNTIYAKRDVIGNLDVIKNFKYDELRSFYHEWYRTDLQAVAVVGDIDVDEVEKKIKKIFSTIPAIINPKERKEIIIPDNETPGYIQVTDADIKTASLSVTDRYKLNTNNTLGELREAYVRGFFMNLINQRIQEKQRSTNVAFISAAVRVGYVERGYASFEIYLNAKQERLAEAYASVYLELQRVAKHGFTDDEVERIKTNAIMSSERIYNQKDKIDSDSYCKQIKTAYLDGNIISTPEFVYEFAKEVIPTITKEEIAAILPKYFTGKNRNYIVVGPDAKHDEKYITQKQIEEVMDMIEKSDIKPYVEKKLTSETLMGNNPISGKIIAENKIEKFDAVEWTLSNGAKVIFKYNDFSKGNVVLIGTSDGGSSLYNPKDIPSYNAAASYIKSYGIGEHDPEQLKRILTGKAVSNSFSLGPYAESVSSSTSMGDIETMMQLAYMRFREPRFDEQMFNKVMKQSQERLKVMPQTADAIMKDTIATIEANGNPRAYKYNKEYLDMMDYNRMVEIYKERFANPADFTFFIVGDVDAETLKPYVEQYLASIQPQNAKKEKFVNNKDYFPKKKNEHRINIKMEEEKATIIMKMQAKPKYSRESVIYHRILGAILNLRFTENIREKEGGTYGVSVNAKTSRVPETKHSLTISFNCDPAKADRLKSLVYEELETIQTTVRQDDLDKVVINMKKNNESKVENSSYWIAKLMNHYRYNENSLDEEYDEKVLDSVTIQDIQNTAKRFFKKANVLDFVILPE